MPLPWDVYATPIAARKFGRLGMEHGQVVLRPAFFRAQGGAYGVTSRAACPFGCGDEAPQPGCTCGFYAVADDDELGRLGADASGLVVLDVELSGRIIEHAHGYRASHQQIRRVRLHRQCARCGRRAELLHHRRFGALVPACHRCARRPVTLDAATASLGVAIEFHDEDAAPAPRAARTLLLLGETLGPLAIIGAAAALGILWRPAMALAFAQFALLLWLAFRPNVVGRLGSRLKIADVELARLRGRWNTAAVVFTFACALALGVASVAVSNSVAS